MFLLILGPGEQFYPNFRSADCCVGKNICVCFSVQIMQVLSPTSSPQSAEEEEGRREAHCIQLFRDCVEKVKTSLFLTAVTAVSCARC